MLVSVATTSVPPVAADEPTLRMSSAVVSRPAVLVLAEPTQGVDIGAKEEIHKIIAELAAEGTAVLVVTSDYEEAVQLSDRVVVMQRGQQVAEFDGNDVTAQNLTIAAGG